MAWICALGTATALTNAEVTAALGGQPGLEWSVTGAFPQAWKAGLLNGTLSLTLSINPVYTGNQDLNTTVTGPGVMELTRRYGDMTTTSVLRNGGYIAFQTIHTGSGLKDRVEVPAGTHNLTWRTKGADSYWTQVSYSNAKWMAGLTSLPVQLGVTGNAITLSGSWVGQSVWHHGDGGAAWSGLVASVSPGSPDYSRTMSGAFTGPGIVSFRCMPREGAGRVRVDNGAWENLNTRDVWTRHYRKVEGEGAHVIQFDVPSEKSYEPQPIEMLVDELTLVPDIPLSVALDTPDMVWTDARYNTTYGNPAYGVEMDGARGGAGIVMNESSIAAPFPREALVKIRSQGSISIYRGTLYPQGGLVATEVTPEGTWRTSAYHISDPAGSDAPLTLYTNGSARVDYLEVVEKPATLDAAVGLPPATLTTGGSVPWTVQPVTTIGAYGARIILAGAEQSGWMEHTVTGPAEILLGCYTKNQSFTVKVDGRTAWAGGTNNYRKPVPVRIEVPAGEHVIRYSAQQGMNHSPFDSETWISSIAVNPLPAGGGIAAALDFPAPFGTFGNWTTSDTVSHQGGTSLRPTPAPYGAERELPVLIMPVTGPGYLKYHAFHWYRFGTFLRVDTSFGQSFSHGLNNSSYGGNWLDFPLWIPPGEHHVKFTAENTAEIRLDDFSFTPSQALALEDLVTGEESALQATPAGEPWTAVRKQDSEAPVIVSPLIRANSPKKLAMTVNGPGRISFKWKTFNRAAGSFLVNGARSSTLTLSDESFLEESESLFIGSAGPVTLEWEGAYQPNQTWGIGWIELRDIEWIPVVVTPFAAALDGPAGSTWTTSLDHPFEGYPTPGAVGGTAANVVLKPGDEAWLETTVEGPGVFDFSMLDSLAKPAATPSWVLRKSVTIDGNEHYFYDGRIPSLLILGEGPHVVRLKFWNGDFNNGTTTAAAVDAVTWTPAPSTDAGPEWTADAPESIGSYPGMREYDGKDLIVLHPRAGSTQWIERSITGPGFLTWESRKTPGSAADWREFSLTIDGIAVATEEDPEKEWQPHALHVPAGTHTVRFTAAPGTAPDPLPDEDGGEEEENLPPSWQLAAVTFTPGESPLVRGIDSSEGLWLVTGSAYAELYTTGGTGIDSDYYYAYGPDIHLINPTAEHRMARMLTVENGNTLPVMRQLAPRCAIRWNPLNQYGGLLTHLDTFTLETITYVPLADALDITGLIASEGWQGLATTSAYDGTDAALSLQSTAGTSRFTRQVSGPASVRFRWKSTGEGELRLSINGQLIQPVPTSEWTEVEYRVNEGPHTFAWSHTTTDESVIIPSAAWVDALVIESLPARTLDQAAGSAGFTLTASSPSSPDAWKPTFFQDVFGQWRDVVRATSGESILTTTVTGPAVLSFRAEMWPSVAIGILPPWEEGVFPMRTFILVKVGDENKAVVEWPTGGALGLGETSVYIPPGQHQVSWQLMTLFYMDKAPWAFTRPAVSGYEAWVDDITVQSPRSHYNDWAVASGLAAGESDPKDDADHDGVINFIEYAFRTNPLDSYSKWYPPYLYNAPSYLTMDENPPMRLHVATDFMPAMVKGEFQQSSDLTEWTPVPLGSMPALSGIESYFGWGGLIGSADLEFPTESDQAGRFFRFQFEIPEEE